MTLVRPMVVSTLDSFQNISSKSHLRCSWSSWAQTLQRLSSLPCVSLKSIPQSLLMFSPFAIILTVRYLPFSTGIIAFGRFHPTLLSDVQVSHQTQLCLPPGENLYHSKTCDLNIASCLYICFNISRISEFCSRLNRSFILCSKHLTSILRWAPALHSLGLSRQICYCVEFT
jgi:hypothetical protein